MHGMAHSEEVVTQYDFQWGKKRNKGKNEGVQFYKSFTYDGEEYFLYDCVYLYNEEEPEPYIGKLVKIYEQANHQKKVKVVWFFRQIELTRYLGSYVPQKNEIFIASGKGVGVSNVNDLEVINGKCNVVCTLEDERNRRPSDEEKGRADYIFSHTFDVGNFKISNKIKDAIAGIDVNYFFNRKKSQPWANISKLQAKHMEKHKSLGLSRLNSVKAVGSEVKDEKANCIANPAGNGDEVKRMGYERKEHKSCLLEKTLSRPNTGVCKDVDTLYKKPDSPQSVLERKSNVNVKHELRIGSDFDKRKPWKSDIRSFEHKRKGVEDLYGQDRKMARHGERATKSNVNFIQEQRVGSTDEKGRPYQSDIGSSEYKRKSVEDFYGRDGKRVSHGVQATKEGRELAQEKGIGADHQVLGVTQRPVDRSKWFISYSWEQKLRSAYEKGTLLLFDDLDPSYTSQEVQDIVWQAFGVDCTAEVIAKKSFSSRHSGQAFVIFKRSTEADAVVKKLQEGCCMLEDGRPLIARRGTLGKPEKQSKLVGHLSIDKALQKHSREKKKAVATSHCAQSNTIEYDMAVDWIKLQKQSDVCWKDLHEQHEKELDVLRRQLRSWQIERTS